MMSVSLDRTAAKKRKQKQRCIAVDLPLTDVGAIEKASRSRDDVIGASSGNEYSFRDVRGVVVDIRKSAPPSDDAISGDKRVAKTTTSEANHAGERRSVTNTSTASGGSGRDEAGSLPRTMSRDTPSVTSSGYASDGIYAHLKPEVVSRDNVE